MKFLHTADFHLGDSFKILPDGKNLKRQSLAYDEIYEIAEKQKVDVVVIAGDLIHQKNPNRQVRDTLLKKVLEYDALGFKTLIAEGNHDSIDATTTNIHFLYLLYKAGKLKNTIVVELKNRIIKFKDGAFLVMPVFKEKTLVQMAITAYNQGCKWAVAVLHTTTIGVTSDTGWCASKNAWDMKPIQKITYYALGHIHKCQQLALPNAWQSGSPCQHTFGDKKPKGVLIVDTDDPNNPKFVPLKKPKALYVITNINEIPINGYVKLLTNESMLGKDLPSNVVATEKNIQNVKIKEYKGSADPIIGLTEELAKQGLEEAEQAEGLKIVEQIMDELKLE